MFKETIYKKKSLTIQIHVKNKRYIFSLNKRKTKSIEVKTTQKYEYLMNLISQ